MLLILMDSGGIPDHDADYLFRSLFSLLLEYVLSHLQEECPRQKQQNLFVDLFISRDD